MKKIICFLLLVVPGIYGMANTAITYSVSSPDKNTRLELKLENGKLLYRITFTGKTLTFWSALGLQTNAATIGENTSIINKVEKRVYEKFDWRLGEEDVITNNYNEINLACKSGSIDFNLVARIYDGSIAFRYELPNKSRQVSAISKELTDFKFYTPYTLYQYNQETVFTPVSIDTFSRTCDFPATLTNGDFYISIGEAMNDNYTKPELKRGVDPHSLQVAFIRDSSVKVAGKFISPWRTISVATSAIGLHQFSELFLKLNPPAPKASIPPSIKPGKLIRSQLNTQSGLDCIDFAAKHNFQYIMFDAGWYGAEFRSVSDPTRVIPEIDMPRVIQYGKEKGIGVILYVNYVGLRAKLDTILPLYKKWGIAGLKFGFVDGLTQNGITWLANAIRKVNDYGFILDIHDNYKPTGLSRTYPALLTQEGIRGDENSPDAFHTTVLPFTRFIAGPADFTFCYPNAKDKFTKNLKVSMGQQLALTVIYFSPLQSIFWYGKPNDYTNENEIEFFKYVPTVWSESHYLAGEIGKNISVARRSGNSWFVGNAAGFQDWNSNISFNFLSNSKIYSVTVFEDDEKNSIRTRTFKMKKGDSFSIHLKSKTGQAIMLTPIP